MTTYLLTVWAHVLLAIALVGYALFWAILSLGGGDERRSLLDLVRTTPWPPRGLPVPVRAPMFVLGWALLALVVLSGALVLGRDGLVPALTTGPFVWVSLRTKAVAVGIAAVLLVVASLRPRRGVLLLFLLTLLGIVSLSGALVR